jgi:hypothetical protein
MLLRGASTLIGGHGRCLQQESGTEVYHVELQPSALLEASLQQER